MMAIELIIRMGLSLCPCQEGDEQWPCPIVDYRTGRRGSPYYWGFDHRM